jgi:RNA polymerase sigma-70 factor, ECF subfamily
MSVHDDKEQELLVAYEKYADALFRHCYFRLYDRETAKDVVQDTFMKTWEYMGNDKIIDNMRAFLYRVANNLVIDRVRKRVPTSLDSLQEKGFDPRDESHHARVTDIVSGKEVVRVLDQLDDTHRTVVIMRYIDDLMPREIATVLGETENAVSVRIHRATKKARDLLNQDRYTFPWKT